MPTANISGGLKAAQGVTGDETESILKNADELGGYRVDGGNITDLQLLNPLLNKIKNISAKAAEKLKLDDLAGSINNIKGLNAKRQKALNLALADPKLTERLLSALRADKSGEGARNIIDLAQNDLNKLKGAIGKTGDRDIKDVIEDYYSSSKDKFGKAIDELEKFKDKETITLSDEAIDKMKNEFSSKLNVFDKSSDKVNLALKGLDSLRGLELGVRDLNELRANYNKGLNEILSSDKNSYNTKINFIEGKRILEDAMDELLNNPEAKQYLKDSLSEYKDYKRIENSDFFKRMISDQSSADDVVRAFNSANLAQGGEYAKFINKLSPEQVEKFELAIIKHELDGATGTTGLFNKKQVLNAKELNETLQNINFISPKAKEVVAKIDKLAKARGNIMDLVAALDMRFIKPSLYSKGIATTFGGASKTAMVNAIRQAALKYIPVFGDDAALEYHLKEAAKAIKFGKNLNEYLKGSGLNKAEKEAIRGMAGEATARSK